MQMSCNILGGNLATGTCITVHHHGKDGDCHWCLTHDKFTQNVLLYFLEKNDYTATGAQINLMEYLCFHTSHMGLTVTSIKHLF